MQYAFIFALTTASVRKITNAKGDKEKTRYADNVINIVGEQPDELKALWLQLIKSTPAIQAIALNKNYSKKIAEKIISALNT